MSGNHKKPASRLITAEGFGSVQRWKLPAVGGVLVESPEDESKLSINKLQIKSKNSRSQTAHKPVTVGQVEEIHKQAYREGFESGKKEGFEKGKKEGRDLGSRQGKAEAKEKIQQFESILQTLSKPLLQLDDAIEQELLSLVMAIARQVIRRELKTDPGQVIAVVREAVGALPLADAKVRVFLHPEDAALVREALTMPEDEYAWQVVEDPVLSRGGCKVVTETSQVDASLDTRLAALVSGVFGEGRQSD
ncbi:MAG: flagellar assembly protein FliH [Gammaproteobacteria bacterium]|nr:flagellar assembly protein FliH [Gammaproteobacteria bacterium]